MTTSQQAFSPSSIASAAGQSVAQQAIKSMGAAGGVLSGIPGFSSSSSARSGDIGSTNSYDGSGFSVNYGNGVSQGATKGMDVPAWVWLAAAAAVGVVVWKKFI